MKTTRLILVNLALLMAFVAWGQPKPSLKFDKQHHDFGTIEEDGGLVSTRFSFQNVSGRDTKILDVVVSCGCTSPTYTKETLASQDTGSILITFDPMDRPGHFEKYIRVEMSTGPELVIKIHGEVSPRPKGPRDWYPFFVGNLWFKQSNMFVGTVYNDASATFTNVVYNASDKAITIDWDKSTLPGDFVELSASGKQKIAPKDSIAFDLTYDAAKRNDWGYVVDTLHLATDDEEMPEKVIMAGALIKERFDTDAANAQLSVDREDHAFGDVDYGSVQATTFTITNTGEAPLFIRKIRSNCSCLTADITQEGIAPGASAKLVVSLDTGDRMGWMRKMLTLITNDPKADFKNLIIKAEVLPPKTNNNGGE